MEKQIEPFLQQIQINQPQISNIVNHSLKIKPNEKSKQIENIIYLASLFKNWFIRLLSKLGFTSSNKLSIKNKEQDISNEFIIPQLLMIENQQKISNCSNYVQVKQEQSFNFYLKTLKSQLTNTKNPFKQLKTNGQSGIIKKILVGESGVGKSSLINTLFGTNLQIALYDCTSQIYKVYEQNKIQIFDSPGDLTFVGANNIYNGQYIDEKIEQIKKELIIFDEIYVVYDTSLKKIMHFVKLLIAMHSDSHRLKFVRNKYDNFDQRQKRSFEEEIEVDKILLIQWGMKAVNLEIYATSNEEGFLKDNENLKKTMLSKNEQDYYQTL